MNIVKKAKDSVNKRSVDAYGKAVELAITTHLLDTGDYPTDLNGLIVEYTRNEVVCNVKTLNEDGSIYLSECSVKNNEVKDSNTEDGWYHYGKSSAIVYQSYGVGDIIKYNGMNFYVIEDSDEKDDRVTMLKAEPLTVDEVNKYGGVGTDNNHVNMYVHPNETYYQIAYNNNGYGGMAYYTSSTCGYDASVNYSSDGCTTDYAQSEVKYVVDAWSNDKLNASDLTEDSLGYKTRLLTFEDLTNNLGYEKKNEGTIYPSSNGDTPSWVHNSNYWYWTMSTYADSSDAVWIVGDTSNGAVNRRSVYTPDSSGFVRPVITLKKSAI